MCSGFFSSLLLFGRENLILFFSPGWQNDSDEMDFPSVCQGWNPSRVSETELGLKPSPVNRHFHFKSPGWNSSCNRAIKKVRNCRAASVGKWNPKIWYQTSWLGSNFHREEITKLHFEQPPTQTFLRVRHAIMIGNSPLVNLSVDTKF